MISPQSLRSIKWAIRAYLSYNGYEIVIKRISKMKVTKPSDHEGKGIQKCFVIYRHEILRLLHHKKSAHDQLFFELPILEGFRAKEVTTLRLEYCNFEHEDLMVFDAKKHRLLGPIPMARKVATHIMECSRGRTEGYVIENESTACQGRNFPLSNVAVWYKWQKYAQALNLYPSPREYSPIVGRRFFIAETLRVRKDEPLGIVAIDLMRWVRHADIAELLNYASHIHFYEDEKIGYDRFQNGMERAVAELPIQEARV